MFKHMRLLLTIFFILPGIANAQLLSNLATNDRNTAEEILKLLLPIATYDPKVVNPKVIENNITVFKGIDDDLKTEYSKTLDDKNVYKWLNAKDGETLLRIPVVVSINENHLTNYKNLLSELANDSKTLDGSENPGGKHSINGKNNVFFYSGAIKGMPRTQISKEHTTSPVIENYYALGFKSMSARIPALGGEGAWVHKPFKYYGFNKEHNNGKLCTRLVEKIANEIKDPGIFDEFTKSLKPGSDNWWNLVSPAISLKFYDSSNKVLLEDTLISVKQGGSSDRHASVSGWGSAKVGENDTYQSIVIADTTNGWHPSDRYLQGNHPLDDSTRFSYITRPIAYAVNQSRQCTFAVAENTNFAIVTKVSNDIIKNTAKITVEYGHKRGWMTRPECSKDGWEKNVNCKRD